MGKATAKSLAEKGANVVLVARDEKRGEQVAREIRDLGGQGEIEFLTADIGEMNSVRRLAENYRARFPRVDVLLHSAGIINLEKTLTAEGIEMNFAVNYLGRYLLTNLLDGFFQSDARIIAMATANVQPIRFNFAGLTQKDAGELGGFRAYQQSQAANDVWGLELAERLRPRNIKVAVVAPGIVKTKIRQNKNAPLWLKLFDFVSAPFALSVEQGSTLR